MIKFKAFKQHKLFRDKIIDKLEQEGSKLYWSTLSDKDFQKQLKLKLLEEAQEVQQVTSKQNLLEELADVLEVVQTLAALHEIPLKELSAFQKKKYEELGGFEGRKFVTRAEHPKDSSGERYCLANPDKYPEIKN